MTLKYQQLEQLIYEIERSGLRSDREISDNKLRFFIGKHFGISEYTIQNVKKALVEFDFIDVIGIGTFRIKDKSIDKKQAEKQAEKEADEVLRGFK